MMLSLPTLRQTATAAASNPRKALLRMPVRFIGNVFQKPRVVILGSGWAGNTLARRLQKAQFDVRMISPSNHFLFTPLLPSTGMYVRRLLCNGAPQHFLLANLVSAVKIKFMNGVGYYYSRDNLGRECFCLNTIILNGISFLKFRIHEVDQIRIKFRE